MQDRKFWFAIALIIAIHWAVVGLFAFDIIPQQTKRADTWFWFHHGGDNWDYYDQLQELVNGTVGDSRVPLGYTLMMFPSYWLSPDKSHDALVQPNAFFWAMVMFPLGVALLAWTCLRITKNHLISLATCLVYVLLPLLYLAIFSPIYDPRMAEIFAIHSTWAQMLSDGPAAFLSLATIALFFYTREQDYPLTQIIIIGLLIGYLTTLRSTGILVGTGIGLVLLADRRWTDIFWMGTFWLIGFAPQLVYNTVAFGSPLSSGYQIVGAVPDAGLFHLSHLINGLTLIWNAYGIIGASIVIVGLVYVGIGLYALWRMGWVYTTVIGGWLIAHIGLYSIYYYTWDGAGMRFMIPIEGIGIFVCLVTLYQLHKWTTTSAPVTNTQTSAHMT